VGRAGQRPADERSSSAGSHRSYENRTIPAKCPVNPTCARRSRCGRQPHRDCWRRGGQCPIRGTRTLVECGGFSCCRRRNSSSMLHARAGRSVGSRTFVSLLSKPARDEMIAAGWRSKSGGPGLQPMRRVWIGETCLGAHDMLLFENCVGCGFLTASGGGKKRVWSVIRRAGSRGVMRYLSSERRRGLSTKGSRRIQSEDRVYELRRRRARVRRVGFSAKGYNCAHCGFVHFHIQGEEMRSRESGRRTE